MRLPCRLRSADTSGKAACCLPVAGLVRRNPMAPGMARMWAIAFFWRFPKDSDHFLTGY